MNYLGCNGSITENVDGFPLCSDGWLVVSQEAIIQQSMVISQQDSAELWPLLLGLLVLGGSIKILRNVFSQNLKGG
ncbi:hypothetical protein [Neptunomonas antarctica]|uniref:Uncharacterized protein n=1 Tax=Neptunomonas antarctica TaxID=619304 RepID=A0A1N7J5J5_9GAMM|nr:hypothetical protein [Neptunomonas antarctica]SIS44633.1 hypothetical protein SAMN05421760_101649 [Neptunomonas antarctica]